MKKMLVAIVAAGVVSLAGSSPAAAQTSESAIVKVPFQFIVGHRVLPAGSYRIEPVTTDWVVVRISNVVSGKAVGAFVATQALTNPEPMRTNALVTFVSYQGHYFLQRVALPGRDVRELEITETQAEDTLAKLNLVKAEPANPAK